MSPEPAATGASPPPASGRLLWSLYMQPVWLHQRLRASTPAGTDRAWAVLGPAGRERGPALSGVRQPVVVLFLAATSLAAGLTAAVLALAGWLAEPLAAAGAVAAGATGAVLLALTLARAVDPGFAVAVAPALAVGLAAMAGLVLALATGAEPSLGLLLAVSGMSALASGFCFDPAVAVGDGRVSSLGSIAASGLAAAGIYAGLAYLVADRAGGPPASQVALAVGVAYAVLFCGMRLRLFLYPLEAIVSALLYRSHLSAGRPTLARTPLLFHDLGRLPLPYLRRHLLLAMEREPSTVGRVLEACRRGAAHRAMPARLMPYFQAREVEALGLARDFSRVARLQGKWLPGIDGADVWLLAFRDVARYLEGAAAVPTPFRRLERVEEAERILAGLEAWLLSVPSDLARAVLRTVAVWQEVVAELRTDAEATARRELPNPFRAGEPLTPERGQELFRGRQDLVAQIVALLADARGSWSIALLGPRRCGKTSLLNMLPVLLPDALCVFFDLQDNPVDSPEGFFRALAARAAEQARRDRRLELPPLPPGPAFEAGRRWFEELEEFGRRQRILLCLDEFERLETLFPGERRGLVQLMGLFRGTIQHRRHVRILVSGTAPFDELGSLWNDHLINFQELRVGHLDEETAVDLLCRPVVDFPADTISPEVARLVHRRTGGQPYLLQLYGSLLVSRLNAQRRPSATAEDVHQVEEEAMMAATYFFRHTLQEAPPEAREVLTALAAGGEPVLAPRPRTWLARRSLVGDDGRLAIPVFGRWIRQETEVSG